MVKVLNKSQVCGDNRTVIKVRVTVHTYGAHSGDRSYNHWSVYLLLPDGTNSVRANIRAKFDGYNNGLLEWSDLGYIQSTSEIRHWEFNCKSNVKIRDVADCIYQKGREKYDLKDGSGCRYWVYVVIDDLAKKNLIDAGSGATIWPHLLKLYHTTNAPKGLPMVQGNFYA